jgi:ABC-type transporter MlaC component
MLVDSVDQTLIRYAFEGLESYGGQVFKVDDVVVNEEKGMGWVQVLMESPILPDINLDLVIKRNPKNEWHAVDVRVKGITYVKIKKYKYREIIEEQGFDALIDNLTTKNTNYFDDICAPLVNPKQKGRAPC